MWVDLGVHLISASPLLMKTVLCFVIPSLSLKVFHYWVVSRWRSNRERSCDVWLIFQMGDDLWCCTLSIVVTSQRQSIPPIKCFVVIISSTGSFLGVWLWAHNVWKVVERIVLNLGQFNVFMGGLLLALKLFYNPALKTGLPVQSTSQQNSQQQLDWQVSQMHARIHFLLPQNFTNIPEENCFSYFFFRGVMSSSVLS